jgi:hypothetical protein
MNILNYRAKDLVDFVDAAEDIGWVHAICKGCGECMWSDDNWTPDSDALLLEALHDPKNHKEDCQIFKKIQENE